MLFVQALTQKEEVLLEQSIKALPFWVIGAALLKV